MATRTTAPIVNGTSIEPFQMLVDARPPAVSPPVPPVVRVRESPPGPDGRPRAPRREVEVAIDGYPGYTAWVWSNYPRRLAAALNDAADEAAITGVLRQLVVAHNGWCDTEGEPYPPADDPGFYEAIPLELAVLLLRAINQAPSLYPQSLSPTAGR